MALLPDSHHELDRYLPPTPLMSASETARAMGFSSTEALAKARLADRLPIDMFQLPGRRGWFAATQSVRAWLVRTLPTSADAPKTIAGEGL